MAPDIEITDKDVINCCGQTMYERGLEYFRQNRVKNVTIFGNKIKSRVIGSANYSVQIEINDKNIYGECTCPVGDSCKHVAATLLFLKNKRSGTVKIDDIASYLNDLPKEDLVRLIVNAPSDAMLRTIKLDMASRKKSKVDVETYREEIDNALELGHYFDYGNTFGLIEELKDVKTSLEKLVASGFYKEGCSLIFHFIKGCIRKEEECDDSNGDLGELIVETGDLLAKALKDASADDIMLQELIRLYKSASDYGVEDCVCNALNGLDIASLKMLEKIVANRKENVFKQLLREIVDLQGRHDEYIKMCCESEDYQDAIQKLREIGRLDDAIKLAREKSKKDDWLQEDLFDLYVVKGDMKNALVYAWKLFKDDPEDMNFVKILEVAEKLGIWKSERTKIIQYLENSQENNDMLIELLLEDHNPRRALKYVKDIDEGILAKLAAACEDEMPDASIKIYRELTDKNIDRMGNDHYKAASKYLARLKKLYKKTEKEKTWVTYVEDLRKRHKPKRNLIALISDL